MTARTELRAATDPRRPSGPRLGVSARRGVHQRRREAGARRAPRAAPCPCARTAPPARSGVPGFATGEPVIAQAAVLGVDEVEVPQRHLAAGDGGAEAASAHGREQPSMPIHSSAGHSVDALATVCRRVWAAVSTLRARCPLISSMLLNFVDHAVGQPAAPQLANNLAASERKVVRPLRVRWRRPPSIVANPPALDHSGQANDAIGSRPDCGLVSLIVSFQPMSVRLDPLLALGRSHGQR